MVYRPDDPYNTGIGTPYLGNIDQGQNRHTAGAWGKYMPEKLGGYSEEKKAQNAALEKIEGLRKKQKSITGGVEVSDDVMNNLQMLNPTKYNELKEIENKIQQIKNQYKGVDAIDQASSGWDLSGIKDQTALLPPWLMGAGKNYFRNRAMLTGANYVLSTGEALANARKKQRMSDKQYDDWRRHTLPALLKHSWKPMNMSFHDL